MQAMTTAALISMAYQFTTSQSLQAKVLEYSVRNIEVGEPHARGDADAASMTVSGTGRHPGCHPGKRLTTYEMPRAKLKQTQSFCHQGMFRNPRTGSGRQSITTSSERLAAASAAHLIEKPEPFGSGTKMSQGA